MLAVSHFSYMPIDMPWGSFSHYFFLSFTHPIVAFFVEFGPVVVKAVSQLMPDDEAQRPVSQNLKLFVPINGRLLNPKGHHYRI